MIYSSMNPLQPPQLLPGLEADLDQTQNGKIQGWLQRSVKFEGWWEIRGGKDVRKI